MISVSLLLCFMSANAQFLFAPNAIVSHHGGYTYEFHPDTHLLTVRNIYSCYFVTTNKHMEDIFRDRHLRKNLEVELLGFIHNHQHFTKTSLVQSSLDHSDSVANSNCVGRELFELTYPTGGATTTSPITQGATATLGTTYVDTTSSTPTI